MNRSTKIAAIVVIMVMAIIFAVGAFIILQPANADDTSWVPKLDYYVTDDTYVLDEADYNDLDQFCHAVEQNNTCQLAVLIVNGTDYNRVHVGVNDLAIKVFEKNGIGQKGKDNGVLFVLSTADKSWRVVTGKGVEGILSGAKLTELQDSYLIPYLDAPGNYSTGITLFVCSIGLELTNNYVDPGPSPSPYPIDFIPLNGTELVITVVVFLALMVVTRGRAFLWIGLLFGRGGRGGFGGGSTGGGGSKGRF
ncbi:MAG TPA: TPM domain-containing protein [Methanomassiliicoccales archaeon]|jgi:uncharacterized protein